MLAPLLEHIECSTLRVVVEVSGGPVLVLKNGDWIECGPGEVMITMQAFDVPSGMNAETGLNSLINVGIAAAYGEPPYSDAVKGRLYVRQPFFECDGRTCGRYGVLINLPRPLASAATPKASKA